MFIGELGQIRNRKHAGSKRAKRELRKLELKRLGLGMMKLPVVAKRGIAEHTHILRIKLFKPVRCEPLGIILTLARPSMFLMDVIVVMPKLMNKDVEEHVGTSLGGGEAADETILISLVSNTQSIKDIFVILEIIDRKWCP